MTSLDDASLWQNAASIAEICFPSTAPGGDVPNVTTQLATSNNVLPMRLIRWICWSSSARYDSTGSLPGSATSVCLELSGFVIAS
jgi:hypothetical protein